MSSRHCCGTGYIRHLMRRAVMSDNLQLDGRRALVTGGTQGIGKAVVARLREAGATLLTTARTLPAELPDRVLFVAADIATAVGCEMVAEAARDRLGGGGSGAHIAGARHVPPGRGLGYRVT